MNVLITLTSAGTDLGPFDLYSDTDGYTAAFESGILRTQLLAGYTSTVVPDGTTNIRLTSTGACTNSIDVPVVVTTTTTTTVSPTTTTTTTAVPPGTSVIMTETGTVFNAVCDGTALFERWHDGSVVPEVNDTIYSDDGLTSTFDGQNQYYKLITDNYIRVDSLGVVTDKQPCNP